MTSANEDVILIDGHSDALIDVVDRCREGDDARLSMFHLPRWRKGGVDAALCPIWVDAADPTRDPLSVALRNLDVIFRAIDDTDGEVRIALSAEEVHRARVEGAFAVLLGMEGAMPLQGDAGLLHVFARLGLRWIGLTWNLRNELGDGLGVAKPGGLTSYGQEVIHEMNRMGLVLDLTHASAPTLAEAIRVSTSPPFVSHSNARVLCDHPRNLDDEQIRTISAAGGVVGVNFFPSLVADSEPTLEDILKHVEYLERVGGAGHVALGPDFIDYSLDIMGASLHGSGMDYGESLVYPQGAEDTTRLREVVDSLLETGEDSGEVANIAGLSILSIFARSQHGEHAF